MDKLQLKISNSMSLKAFGVPVQHIFTLNRKDIVFIWRRYDFGVDIWAASFVFQSRVRMKFYSEVWVLLVASRARCATLKTKMAHSAEITFLYDVTVAQIVQAFRFLFTRRHVTSWYRCWCITEVLAGIPCRKATSVPDALDHSCPHTWFSTTCSALGPFTNSPDSFA